MLLVDLGFTDYGLFDTLTQRGVAFITRLKSNAAIRTVQVLREGPKVKDRTVALGASGSRCQAPMRVVEVEHQGQWYRYLTNETDAAKLPAEYVVGLYWQRWRIEEAYQITKRLLGLAYFAVGSIQAVQVQLWATWILYSVLIDLSDAVAQALDQPMAGISVEMVFRGLYHYTQARQRGDERDVVRYLANEAKGLGILKTYQPKSQHIVRLLTSQLSTQLERDALIDSCIGM